MRIEFICIIWTRDGCVYYNNRSWGLNLFVLFEQHRWQEKGAYSSWGLNLFVLFELVMDVFITTHVLEDWIYLYYLNNIGDYSQNNGVLEDWIYLYYLNRNLISIWEISFLRIEFICIIWTNCKAIYWWAKFLRIEFICIIWTQILL